MVIGGDVVQVKIEGSAACLIRRRGERLADIAL